MPMKTFLISKLKRMYWIFIVDEEAYLQTLILFSHCEILKNADSKHFSSPWWRLQAPIRLGRHMQLCYICGNGEYHGGSLECIELRLYGVKNTSVCDWGAYGHKPSIFVFVGVAINNAFCYVFHYYLYNPVYQDFYYSMRWKYGGFMII